MLCESHTRHKHTHTHMHSHTGALVGTHSKDVVQRGRALWRSPRAFVAVDADCDSSSSSGRTTSSPVVVSALCTLVVVVFVVALAAAAVWVLVPVFAFYRSVNDHIVYTGVCVCVLVLCVCVCVFDVCVCVCRACPAGS